MAGANSNDLGVAGVYIFRSIIDDRCYVGSAVCLYTRYHQHKSTLLSGKHRNPILQNFVQKHGFESLEYEILERCDRSVTVEREQYYIDTMKPRFNISPSACSSAGRTYPFKRRQPLPEETKKKISLSLSGKPGHPCSEATKRKLAKAMRGRLVTPEWRRRISLAKKGRASVKKHAAATLAKMSKAARKRRRRPDGTWIKRSNQ